MGMFQENNNVVARGFLRLYEESTGKEIGKSNLVVNNSAHIQILALGGDITSNEIRFSSWGDVFSETPTASNVEMDGLEAEGGFHTADGNHTVQAVSVLGHKYPSNRAITFTFKVDRNSAIGFAGKNILEWGLFFNGIMFSRVVLQTDFVFENWMSVVGEWTIILSPVGSCKFASFLLNQYNYTTIWDFNSVANDQVLDIVDGNHLTPLATNYQLTKDTIGDTLCLGTEISDKDIKFVNSAPISYDVVEPAATIPETELNLFYILDQNQIGMDLGDQFSMFTWFKFSECYDPDLYEQQVILSKWSELGLIGEKSYRLSVVSDIGTVNQMDILFEINVDGTIEELRMVNVTEEMLNSWNLFVVTKDPTTHDIKMYVNGAQVDVINTGAKLVPPVNTSTFVVGSHQLDSLDNEIFDEAVLFDGFVDQTGFSTDTFSDDSIMDLWNDGIGDFYRA